MIVFTHPSNAQDADIEARILYQQAEDELNQGNYKISIDKLSRAEALIGQGNKKILYLKIQNYERLLAFDWSYITILKVCISDFFSGDMNTISKEKQLDVTSISVNLKDKLAQYEQSFLSLKTKKNYDQYKLFLTKYPNSEYGRQLQIIYKNEIEEERLKFKQNEFNMKLNDISESYRVKLKRTRVKSIVFLSLGVTLTGFSGYMLSSDKLRSSDKVLAYCILAPGILFDGLGIGYSSYWIHLSNKKRSELKRIQLEAPTIGFRSNAIQVGFNCYF